MSIKTPTYLAYDGANYVVLDAKHTSLCYVRPGLGKLGKEEANEIIDIFNERPALLAQVEALRAVCEDLERISIRFMEEDEYTSGPFVSR